MRSRMILFGRPTKPFTLKYDKVMRLLRVQIERK
jgi:hypothetical protein